MEKIVNFIKSKTVIDIIFLISVVILFTFLFGFSANAIFSDRGREFLFPLWILKGLAPYKDFVTIYFPLSYYINALVYKVLGVSINSLVIFQSFICMLYISFYYLIAREFINRKTAIILSVFTLISCVFNISDLFGYILPYCYGRINGLLGSIICLYGIIKLYKTDNIKFAYLASISAGFAASNKMEFTSLFLLLIIGFSLYKKLKITQYLKLFLSFLIFPLITLSLLFFSGVRIPDIIDAIKFSIKFSSTPGMKYFFTIIGLVPSVEVFVIDIFKYLKAVLQLGILIFISYLNYHFNKKYLSPVFLLIALSVCILFNQEYIYKLTMGHHWDYIIFVVGALFLIFYKNIFKDKEVLIFLIATVLIGMREIFKTHILSQGAFSIPLLILFIVIIFENYFIKYASKEKVMKIINFFFIILICSHLFYQYKYKIYIYTPLKTNKGTVYMFPDVKEVIEDTMNYIENNIPKDARITYLPEGILFDYFLDRDTNYKCFMMDRLYHDAYGEKEAYEIIKNTNSDYFIIVSGFDLFDYGYEFLYNKNVSLSANYIYDNYTKVHSKFAADEISNISIYKRNSK